MIYILGQLSLCEITPNITISPFHLSNYSITLACKIHPYSHARFTPASLQFYKLSKGPTDPPIKGLSIFQQLQQPKQSLYHSLSGTSLRLYNLKNISKHQNNSITPSHNRSSFNFKIKMSREVHNIYSCGRETYRVHGCLVQQQTGCSPPNCANYRVETSRRSYPCQSGSCAVCSRSDSQAAAIHKRRRDGRSRK